MSPLPDDRDEAQAEVNARMAKIRDDIHTLPTAEKLHLAAEMLDKGPGDMALSVARLAVGELVLGKAVPR